MNSQEMEREIFLLNNKLAIATRALTAIASLPVWVAEIASEALDDLARDDVGIVLSE